MPKTYHHLSKRRKNQLISFHMSQLHKTRTTSNVPKKHFKTNSNVEMICNSKKSVTSESTTFSNETNTLLSNNIFDSSESNNIPNLSMNNYSSSTSNTFDIPIASDNSSLSNFFIKSIDFNNEISVQDVQNLSLQEDLQILVSECCIPQGTVENFF